MFMPMALTVIIALAVAFVLSLTFVPAMIALVVTGKVQEEDNRIVRDLKRAYAPALRFSLRRPLPVAGAAALLFLGSLLLGSRLGTAFIPQLDEGNIAVQSLRIPSTALTQSQSMQFSVEREISEQDMQHQRVSDADFRRLVREGQIMDGATVAAYGLMLLHEG